MFEDSWQLAVQHPSYQIDLILATSFCTSIASFLCCQLPNCSGPASTLDPAHGHSQCFVPVVASLRVSSQGTWTLLAMQYPQRNPNPLTLPFGFSALDEVVILPTAYSWFEPFAAVEKFSSEIGRAHV